MKTSIADILFVIPLLFFVDWIIMVVAGCFSNLCGANNGFYSTIYLYFGIFLLLLTSLFACYIFIKQIFRHRIDV